MKYGRGAITLTDLYDAQEMYYEQDTEPSDAGVGISVQNEARTIVVGNEDVHNKAHYTCNVFKE